MLLKSAIRLARLHCRQSPRSAALVTLGRHALERKHPHARELVKAVSVVVELMSDNLQQGSDHTTLKKASFAQTLKLKALRVQAKQCQSLMKKFAGYTLNRPRTRCIVSDGDSKSTRLLLLTDSVKDTDDLPQSLKALVQQDDIAVADHTLHIGYDQMSADQVIRSVVPESVQEVTHAFESIGHIAHLNLRDELLPYKQTIGQVILDKNPAIKTVVNKVGNIENEYRVFRMDVIAGQPVLETEVKQHSAKFKLDYSQVYWNSRLETEHKRLVDTFKAGQVVVDVMAGIGPFAIPAAQRGCKVLANDLNPISYKYLQQNIKLNKVQSRVTAFNRDGRDFIRQQCDLGKAAVDLQQRDGTDSARPSDMSDQIASPGMSAFSASPARFDHAIMNLPASAIEFLDAFHGAFDRGAWKGDLPMIHCYCFQRKDETQTDVQDRVEKALGGALNSDLLMHEVRLVAPNKKMLCLSFRIPPTVAFATRPQTAQNANDLHSVSEQAEQQSKRQRTLT